MNNGSDGSITKSPISAPSAAIEPVAGCPWPPASAATPWFNQESSPSSSGARIRASFLRKNPLGPVIPERWIDYVCRLAEGQAWMHYYLWEAYQVLELLDEKRLDGLRILEPGCGAGVIGGMFALMGAEVTLFDNDAGTLSRAREHASALGVARQIQFVQGDMLRCQLPKRSFDLVWNDGTIEHFEDPISIVQSMACLAKPGGRVLVTVPNKWTAHTFLIRPFWRMRKAYTHDRWGKEKSFSERELQTVLEGAGLSDIRTNTHHLRRALVDDRLRFLQILSRVCRPLAAGIINTLDAAEASVPGIRKLGFMVGAVGRAGAPIIRQSGSDAILPVSGNGALAGRSTHPAMTQ